MKVFYVAAIATAMFLTGCAGSGPNVSGGAIFTSVHGPINATPMKKSTKMGEACATNILGMIATGDNSVMAAKKAGAIGQVATIDYKRFSILGVIYEKVCTIVKGS